MRAIMFFGFLFALLPMAAIGHDGYMAYLTSQAHPDLGDPLHAYKFSDLGWLWSTYSADTFHWMRESTDEGLWKTFIDPILRQKTLVVASLPLAILLLSYFISKCIKDLKMGMAGAKGGSSAKGAKDAKKDKFKYKRH